MAQPLPDSIASSNLTRAQERELNRRLSLLQTRFTALANENQLRDAAVQNIAVELFGAQPNLDFDTYAALIESGARELRTYLVDARRRTETDPALAALRDQGIAAAEAGRLTEARGLYDQLIARTGEALETRWAQEDAAREAERNVHRLANAADMAEAARLAFVAADYIDAARRYGEAAARAPEGARERWLYTVQRASALRERGVRFGGDALQQAATILSTEAWSLAPGDAEELETSAALGSVALLLGERGDATAMSVAVNALYGARHGFEPGSPAQAAALDRYGTLLRVIGERGISGEPRFWLNDAVENYREALRIRTREATPMEWAETQHNLAVAATLVHERVGLQWGDPGDPVQMLREVLEVRTREADPYAWAESQDALGSALRVMASGDRATLREAVAAHEAALEVRTRDVAPMAWAQTKHNLALALLAHQDRALLGAAMEALDDAHEFRTRSAAPADWAMTQLVVGLAHLFASRDESSRRAQAREALRAAEAVFRQIRYLYWADQAATAVTFVP